MMIYWWTHLLDQFFFFFSFFKSNQVNISLLNQLYKTVKILAEISHSIHIILINQIEMSSFYSIDNRCSKKRKCAFHSLGQPWLHLFIKISIDEWSFQYVYSDIFLSSTRWCNFHIFVYNTLFTDVFSFSMRQCLLHLFAWLTSTLEYCLREYLNI